MIADVPGLAGRPSDPPVPTVSYEVRVDFCRHFEILGIWVNSYRFAVRLEFERDGDVFKSLKLLCCCAANSLTT